MKSMPLRIVTVHCQVCCALYRWCIFRWEDPHT